MAFDFDMTSGMRKEPPISTKYSPRETITSPPSARVFERKEDCGGVIVHHNGGDSRLRPHGRGRPSLPFIKQFAEQAVDMHIALARSPVSSPPSN